MADGFHWGEEGTFTTHVEAALVLRDASLRALQVGGYSVADGYFLACRSHLLGLPHVGSRFPQFIRRSRDTPELKDRILAELRSERAEAENEALTFFAGSGEPGGRVDVREIDAREWVLNAFEPLLDFLEGLEPIVAEGTARALDESGEAEWLAHHWQSALSNANDAPDVSITAARAFLEEVFDHVLREKGAEPVQADDSLPRRYRAVQAALQLRPEEHPEMYRQILGSCASVVDGFAALRNDLGNAHASSPSAPRASPRHALLATNLAGTVSQFLLDTLAARRDE